MGWKNKYIYVRREALTAMGWKNKYIYVRREALTVMGWKNKHIYVRREALTGWVGKINIFMSDVKLSQRWAISQVSWLKLQTFPLPSLRLMSKRWSLKCC
jgi:hypothetical protein